jgi:hypothetical protein
MTYEAGKQKKLHLGCTDDPEGELACRRSSSSRELSVREVFDLPLYLEAGYEGSRTENNFS